MFCEVEMGRVSLQGVAVTELIQGGGSVRRGLHKQLAEKGNLPFHIFLKDI